MTAISFPSVEAARGCGALTAMPAQAITKDSRVTNGLA